MASIHPTKHGTFEIVLNGRAGPTGVVHVSEEDYGYLRQFNWHLSSAGYAARGCREGSRVRCSLMHREILGLDLGDARCGDHINRNKLDNRRTNLRIVSRAENRQNLSAQGASGLRGVSWDKKEGRWRARVGIQGRMHFLGYFDDLDKAGLAAAEFRSTHLPYSEEAAA